MENNKQYFYILHTKDLKNVVKIIATDHQLKPGDKELDAFPLFANTALWVHLRWQT